MKSFKSYLIEKLEISQLHILYDKINRIAFNNELSRCKLRISSKLNRATGQAKASLIRGELNPESLEIVISDKYALEPETLEMILAHEMIHIWFYTIGDFKETHGSKFKAKASQVGRLLNIQIPLTHDTTGLSLSREPQPMMAVLVISDKGEKFGMFYNYTSYMKNQALADTYMSELIKGNAFTFKIKDARLVIGKSNLSARFKLANAGKVLSKRPDIYRLKDDDVKELMGLKYKSLM